MIEALLIAGGFLGIFLFGFGLGGGIATRHAEKDLAEIRREIPAAFDDGYKQGVREAKPKHDERGRFTR